MHTDPYILPRMQVDKGAIRFILSGANIMCPGLTSAGAQMSEVPAETVVVRFIYDINYAALTSKIIFLPLRVFLLKDKMLL